MTMTPEQAARRTAALFYADLDAELDPVALLAFIKRRWARIAPMAHVMHEAPDYTKGGPSDAERVEGPASVHLDPEQRRILADIIRVIGAVDGKTCVALARVVAGIGA